MRTIDQAVLDRAAHVWLKTLSKLGVRIVAPFALKVDDRSADCLGFLPDFGGPKGMVIGAMDLPQVEPDRRVFELAKKCALFCSFVNVSAFANANVDETVFKNALIDWGYFGSPDNRPAWLAK